ncbi:hypothetical protein QTP88_022682 [Uroleucon formosanum]
MKYTIFTKSVFIAKSVHFAYACINLTNNSNNQHTFLEIGCTHTENNRKELVRFENKTHRSYIMICDTLNIADFSCQQCWKTTAQYCVFSSIAMDVTAFVNLMYNIFISKSNNKS